MYFFFTLEQIEAMEVFAQFNISLMNDFQRVVVLIGVNGFYLLFLVFIAVLIYKTFYKIYDFFF